MKRIFAVFMLAAIATLTFTFKTPTSPKSSAFDHTYGLVAGVWDEGDGLGCTTGTKGLLLTVHFRGQKLHRW